MKHKIFAPAIFKENLKRFWPIVILGFIECYISGPIFILQHSGSLFTANVENVLRNFNFGYALYAAIFPCISALAVFSYMHRNSSVLAMHALPYTRKSLFVSNYLSGLLISVIPVIATALLLAVCKQPTSDGIDFYGSELWNNSAYSLGNIAIWLAMLLIVILFVYSLCVLAAMLTGNVVLQLLTSGGLNLLLPAFYLCFSAYADQFLFGYSAGIDFKVTEYFHPIFWLADGAAGFLRSEKAALWTIIFVGISLAAAAGSYLIYKIRSLERTGDSYVFAPVKWAILVILVFFGTSVFGLGFAYDFGFMAYVIGFAASFLISMMIIRGSFRIGLKKSIIPAVICIAVVAAATAGFAFDIFKLEKYVPKAENVASMDLYGYGLRTKGTEKITDPEEIALITDIHKKIVADFSEEDTSFEWTSFSFEYRLKNGRSVSRHYIVPIDYVKNNEEFNRLYTEYLKNDFAEMFAGIKTAGLCGSLDLLDQVSDTYMSVDIGEFSAEQKQALVDALLEDYQYDSFNEYLEAENDEVLGYIYLYGFSNLKDSMNFEIRKCNRNVLALAKEYITEYLE